MTGFIVLLVNESTGQSVHVEGVVTEDEAIQKAKRRPPGSRAFVLRAQEVTARSGGAGRAEECVTSELPPDAEQPADDADEARRETGIYDTGVRHGYEQGYADARRHLEGEP